MTFNRATCTYEMCSLKSATGRAVYLHCCIRSQLLSSLCLKVITSSLRWRDIQVGNTDVFPYLFATFSNERKPSWGRKPPLTGSTVGIFLKREIFVMYVFFEISNPICKYFRRSQPLRKKYFRRKSISVDLNLRSILGISPKQVNTGLKVQFCLDKHMIRISNYFSTVSFLCLVLFPKDMVTSLLTPIRGSHSPSPLRWWVSHCVEWCLPRSAPSSTPR